MPAAADLSKPRIAVLGTPSFAAVVLEALAGAGKFDIACVVTEIDKPAGRGHKLQPPPAKISAARLQLPVLQPASLRGLTLENKLLKSTRDSTRELADFLNAHQPFAVLITAAYGKILPRALLDFPIRGIINVHASLLPRWRGAAPIHRALFEGDPKTGVCLMQTELKLDTGPVFCSAETPITAADNFATLHDRLAQIGSQLLAENLLKIISGDLKARPQSAEGVTHAAKWEADDREINWSEPAKTTLARIRTCAPVPGAKTQYGDLSLKILAARQAKDQNFPKLEPGSIVEVNRSELILAAGSEEFIAVDELQFPGKSRLPIADVLRGRKFSVGERFN